jgi:heme exporter protein B
MLLLRKSTIFILAVIIHTVKFFIKEEWKNKYAVMGVFIYIFTAVLISFLALPGMDKPHFSAIFWIVVLFTTLQGISKTFITMKKGNFVFWHQMVSPQVFLGGKLVLAFLLMFIFTSFAFLMFMLIHGSVSDNAWGFYLVSLFTGAGISFIYTISSSIAAKTDSPGILLPVLSFPLTIPIILIGVKGGKNAIDDLGLMTYFPEILLLIGFDILMVMMGLALIKFIWKE